MPKERSPVSLLSRLAFFMLCLLMAYSASAGTGVFLHVGAVSFWRIVMLCFALFAIIPFFKNISVILRMKSLWMLLALAVIMAIEIVIGIKNGYSSSSIVQDVKSLIYFVMFPLIASVLNDKRRGRILMKVIMFASFLISIFTCVFFLLYLHLPLQFADVRDICYRAEFLNLTEISNKIVRILFVSTPFQLCACAFPFYFQLTEKKASWPYGVISGVGLFAIMISYTRALYLAAFISAITVIVVCALSAAKELRVRLFKQIAIAVLTLGIITLCSSISVKTNFFGYALERVFVGTNTVEEEMNNDVQHSTQDNVDASITEEQPTNNAVTPEVQSPAHSEIPEFNTEEEYLEATLVSDELRKNLRQRLIGLIKQSPVIGNGLGLTLEGRAGVPEYFFLDLWAKMGIFGLFFFLLPAGYAFFVVIKRIVQRKDALLQGIWFSVLVGLLVYAIFQPYMNNAPCILFYCCVLCVTELSNSSGTENMKV